MKLQASAPSTVTFSRQLQGAPARGPQFGKLADDDTFFRVSGPDFAGVDFSDNQAFSRLLSSGSLKGADLSDAVLDGKDLNSREFTGASFDGVRWHNGTLATSILTHAHFNRSAQSGKVADLSGLFLHGSRMDGTQFLEAILDGATLSQLDATGASFKQASMLGADMTEGLFIKSTFNGANLTGADLSGSQFNDPHLSMGRFTRVGQAREWASSFRDALLHGADLTGSQLVGADFSRAKFNALPPKTGEAGVGQPAALFLNTHLEHARFNQADLTGVVFEKTWLQGADMGGAILKDADFRLLKNPALLKDASFRSAQLQGARLDDLKLEDVAFSNANMQGAYLTRATLDKLDLDGADLTGAKLDGTRLQGANLKGAHLEGADLRNAHLEGADLTDATFDADTQWAGAKFNRQTKFPKSFTIPDTMVHVTHWLDKLPHRD